MNLRSAAGWAASNVGSILVGIAGFALLMIVLGIKDCRDDARAREAAMENIRLRAALDTTKLEYQGALGSVWGRTAFLSESLHQETEAAKEARERAELRLLSTSRVLARLKAQGADTVAVQQRGTDQFIPLPDSIPPFRLSGGVTIRDSTAMWDIGIEVSTALHVDIRQDPETCAVSVAVTATDPAVQVDDLRSAVQDRIVEQCLDDDESNFWLWTAVAEGAVLLALIFGR